MIDTVVGGILNAKMFEGSMELFEKMAMNSYQWYSSRIDTVTALAMQIENLNKRIDGLMVTKQQMLISHCDLYGGNHRSQEC